LIDQHEVPILYPLMKTCHDLPIPSPLALSRSMHLCEIIQQKIQQHNGQVTFADFMELALYHPDYGYYQDPGFKLGKLGDFTTAPELSPLFAHCFARQCQQIFTEAGDQQILELGAGSGQFALDLLTRLESIHALPSRYTIVEISNSLVQQQQARIAAVRPDLLKLIEWLPALPPAISGIVIANEVLDAIPFHCFQVENQQPLLRMVGVQQDQFVWQTAHPTSPELAAALAYITTTYALRDGYQSEIQLPAMSLIRQLCDRLTKGVILLVDYGYGQREYYHPERAHGTLTCFYQHHAHQDPLLYPGLQDITTHIDFTRVIETAASHDLNLLGYTTQCAFLLANGLLEEAQMLENDLPAREQFQLHQAIKTLTLPTEMGETIKVMALGRGYHSTLTGFTTLDRRRDL